MKRRVKRILLISLIILIMILFTIFDNNFVNVKKENNYSSNVVEKIEIENNVEDLNIEETNINTEENKLDDIDNDTIDKIDNKKDTSDESNTNIKENSKIEEPKEENVKISNVEDRTIENTTEDTNIKDENNKIESSTEDTDKKSENNKVESSTEDKSTKDDTEDSKTLDVINDEYRNELSNKYGVLVSYKDEIDNNYYSNYTVPERQYDDEKINKVLLKINEALNKYPGSFFKEIKNKWKPLTIDLVKKVGTDIAGLTDNGNPNTVVILINTEGFLFESTLHHEIMHYIDCYLANIIGVDELESSISKLNPEGFKYGDQTNEYVYYYSQTPYFLSAYSKSNFMEDRAVIFSDMMFRSLKKDYYTSGNPINEKAKVISNQLEKYFDCVSSNTIETWERFIDY